MTASSSRRRGLLLVFAAGALYSTAGLFTRALPFDAWTVLGWRSLFGGLFMMGMIVVERRRLAWRDYALGGSHLVLVPLTAVGTICYIMALNMTSVADVMIVYATTPFVTAAVAWLWVGERPSARTVIASSIALVGVAVMIGGGGPSTGRVLGAALTMAMNVTFALSLVLARRSPDISMTPVNGFGMLLAALTGFVLSTGAPLGPMPLVVAAVFGLVTVGFAMWLFMAGARLVPSAEVALVGISDTAVGPFLVWLAFGENPGLAAIVGGVIVAASVVWNLWPEVGDLLRWRALLPRI